MLTPGTSITSRASVLFEELKGLKTADLVDTINEIRACLHEYSPFKTEPVDCIQWIPIEQVIANDYNPNSVAPPEMKLLELSMQEDGYTQPIVTYKRDGVHEVVDGFHRSRVARESKEINKRIKGHIPVVVINAGRQDRTDRMASTIRHNRARGKHNVDSMSDMVVELKKRNRSDDWIAKHLGMDADEVLRLCQVSGLVEMFSNTEFSQSWDIEVKDDGVDDEVLDEDAL